MFIDRDEIGKILRNIRRFKKMSAVELAAKVGSSQPNISRLERGIVKPSLDLVEAILNALDVDVVKKKKILEDTRLFLATYPNWTGSDLDQASVAQEIVGDRENRSKVIRHYTYDIIPGLLQLPEYSEELLRLAGILDHNERASIVKKRQKRSKILQIQSKTFQFLIEEPSLSQRYTDQTVLKKQLKHLIETAALPNISIRLLRSVTSLSSVPVGPFVIYDDSLVTIETLTHSFQIWTLHHVEQYIQTYFKLVDKSLSPQDTTQYLRDLIERS